MPQIHTPAMLAHIPSAKNQMIHTPFSSYVWAIRLAGIISFHFSLHSFGWWSRISVAMNPGEMQLTRQKSTHSTERHFASWTTPALEALYCCY